MSLIHQLKIGSPLVWVRSDEPYRVLDTIISECGKSSGNLPREVYRMEAFDGLVVWNPTTQAWVRVLIDVGDGILMPTADPSVAIGEVVGRGGVFVVENAHLTAEALIGIYSCIANDFLHAFYTDDVEMLPVQFILISHDLKIPPELAHATVVIEPELLDAAAIGAIVVHLDAKVGTTSDVASIARSGKGMAEPAFVNACLSSLAEVGSIDPVRINTNKMEAIKRTTVLEIRTPKLTLDDIGGMDLAKDLIAKVAWVWHNPDMAAELGIRPVRRVLMVGVSGSGKSAICEAAASALRMELGKTGISQAMNKYVGESEANMRRTFRAVKAMAPICLWIDEFGRDISGGQSSGSVDSGTTDRVHGEFLTGLQELPDNVFLMCAANRIEDVPPEMLRADRFDKILFVGFPAFDERAEIFAIHLGEQAVDHDMFALAQATPFFTGAEIKSLIHTTAFAIGASEHRRITTGDLIDAAPHAKGRVWISHRDAIVRSYKLAQREWEWASSAQLAEADMVCNGKAIPTSSSLTNERQRTGMKT